MQVTRMAAFLVAGLLTGPAVHLAQAQAPPSLQYFSVSPCRVLDTRAGGQGPALASGTPRIVTVTGGSCGIPSTARAIAGSVTSIGPTGAGNLGLYAGDGAPPPTSALNFGSGQTRGNNGVFPLAGNGNGTLAIRATVTGSGTVNVVLDVAGYFVAACPVALTVKNVLAWCSVSIAGGPASAAATQTVCVAQSSVVSLAAVALSTFQLGAKPWHDTDGDTGTGDPGTRTGSGQSETASTTKTVSSGTACAWVCCEFAGAGGGCPATDQCP